MEFNPKQAVDDTNLLARSCMETASRMIMTLQKTHPPTVALTISVDALMTAAVGLLQMAHSQGFIPDVADPARRRLEYLLTLPTYIHERQPDGTFGPGHPLN